MKKSKNLMILVVRCINDFVGFALDVKAPKPILSAIKIEGEQ